MFSVIVIVQAAGEAHTKAAVLHKNKLGSEFSSASQYQKAGDAFKKIDAKGVYFDVFDVDLCL